MMENKIFILTGNTAEGKTTAIIDWMKSNKKRVHGILMPLKNGKRVFFNPYMDVIVSAEASREVINPELIFEIGKFKFAKKSFKVASSWLKMTPPLNTDYLVIDEIGPLELRGEGLEPELSDFFTRVKAGEIKQTVLMVVRESLIKQFINHYQLDHVRIIKKEELDELN